MNLMNPIINDLFYIEMPLPFACFRVKITNVENVHELGLQTW